MFSGVIQAMRRLTGTVTWSPPGGLFTNQDSLVLIHSEWYPAGDRHRQGALFGASLKAVLPLYGRLAYQYLANIQHSSVIWSSFDTGGRTGWFDPVSHYSVCCLLLVIVHSFCIFFYRCHMLINCERKNQCPCFNVQHLSHWKSKALFILSAEPREDPWNPRTSPSSEHRPLLLCPLCTFLCFSTVPSRWNASWDDPSVREREREGAKVRCFPHNNYIIRQYHFFKFLGSWQLPTPCECVSTTLMCKIQRSEMQIIIPSRTYRR